MLKDLIMKSHNLLLRENDNIPLSMRGELEVIVRDKDDNIISYQKDHNTITQWMKHSITHMLAGYIIQENGTGFSGAAEIYSTLQTGHTTTNNPDGMLVSKKQFFSDISGSNFNINNVPGTLTATNPLYISPIYPTKMLFGTGTEFSSYAGASAYYGEAAFESLTGMPYGNSSAFDNNIADDSNYYNASGTIGDPSVSGARTCQPLATSPINTSIPENSTGITGAIKDCLITTSSDLSTKYDDTEKIAAGAYRGIGRPCFVYAERSLLNIFNDITESPGYVKIGSQGETTFNNKITYSVVLPRSSSFYPYDGWIIKEAGLFNDAPFLLGGEETGDNYDKMLAGTLLAKRYISPVLKTQDNTIEFLWSIYINA